MLTHGEALVGVVLLILVVLIALAISLGNRKRRQDP